MWTQCEPGGPSTTNSFNVASEWHRKPALHLGSGAQCAAEEPVVQPTDQVNILQPKPNNQAHPEAMTKSNEAYVLPLTRPGMALDDYDNVTGTVNDHRINKQVLNGKRNQRQ